MRGLSVGTRVSSPNIDEYFSRNLGCEALLFESLRLTFKSNLGLGMYGSDTHSAIEDIFDEGGVSKDPELDEDEGSKNKEFKSSEEPVVGG